MANIRASILFVLAGVLSLVLARAMRQLAGAIDQPADTMAVWG